MSSHPHVPIHDQAMYLAVTEYGWAPDTATKLLEWIENGVVCQLRIITRKAGSFTTRQGVWQINTENLEVLIALQRNGVRVYIGFVDENGKPISKNLLCKEMLVPGGKYPNGKTYTLLLPPRKSQ